MLVMVSVMAAYRLRADCCTPGSAPGPTLGSEYGKLLPLFSRLFIHPFIIAGRGLRPYVGPVRYSRRGWMYASVCMTCRVKEGLSRSEQLVRYFYSAPPLGVSYCVAKLGLALIQCQPEDIATSICFGSQQRG